MKKVIAVLTVLAVFGLTAAPTVSDVSVRQQRKTLEVSYTLAGAPAIVTVDILKDGESIGSANLYRAADGSFTIPAGLGRVETEGANVIEVTLSKAFRQTLADDRVKLTAKVRAYAIGLPPDYAVFDLHTGRSAWFETLEDLPIAFGDDCWRKRYLLMRRIPAAMVRWRMGGSTLEWSGASGERYHYVTLTHDYYMSVYEVTDYQRTYVYSGAVTGGLYPAHGSSFSYDYLRGTEKNWPADGHAVSDGSWLDKLRKLFGSRYAFDLPTEAQWEFAARGGEYAAPRWDMTSDPYTLGYGNNKTSPTKVGTLAANPYGLYDVYGNVWEYCLDHMTANHPAEEVIDPVGAEDPAVSQIVIKGGGHWDAADIQFRAGRRLGQSRSAGNYYGARLTLNIR